MNERHVVNEELAVRNTLSDDMVDLVERWELFAETFHSKEFTDGEHAFGVLFIEFRELVERVEAMGNLIQRFREEQVMQHYYGDSRKLLQALYDQSRFAAEEAAQVGAVALKAIGSKFVYQAGGKHSE